MNNNSFVHNRLFQLLSDQSLRIAFESMRKECSKSRSYSLFKDKIGFEEYLKNVKNLETRTKITKFRSSNHTQMIEKGHHQKNPKHMRFCYFFTNEVETELHFSIKRPTYSILREKTLDKVNQGNPGFRSPSIGNKFIVLTLRLSYLFF